MPEVDGKITHISDTALMVAACRAHESELGDAFIHDPFAAGLAGERGIAILRALPHSNVLRLGLAIRAASSMSCRWTRSQPTRSRLC
jgi:O-methyltransferase involved in polyketide biosynthesis